MAHQTEIAVIGGGLNGSLTALALAQFGFEVTLIDQLPRAAHSDPGFDGRSYALTPASRSVLRMLGLWDGLNDHAQPMRKIHASDGRPGQGPSPLSLQFQQDDPNSALGYMVEDRHLRASLSRAVDAAPVTYMDETTVLAQEIDAAGATLLTDGPTIRAKLIIGADGRASPTADRAGIKLLHWGYDQASLVCAIEHELPHDGAAHQFFMPSGPLAILPLTGNRSSIVWTESLTQARAINALDDADYLDVLRPRFGDFLGGISLCGARYSYPLGLSLRHEMIAPRIALVGDACHGVHPIAGQGLNAGFKDIAALAEVLVDAKRLGEDVSSPQTLARYQEWRRFDNTALAIATDAFNRLFSNDNPIIRAARDLGLAAVNALPGLQKPFQAQASGQSGDVPKLMRGEML